MGEALEGGRAAAEASGAAGAVADAPSGASARDGNSSSIPSSASRRVAIRLTVVLTTVASAISIIGYFGNEPRLSNLVVGSGSQTLTSTLLLQAATPLPGGDRGPLLPTAAEPQQQRPPLGGLQESTGAPACGKLVVPVAEGAELPAISKEERCSLYCKLENIPMAPESFRLSRELHYKTCAVVSSSGAMLRRTRGSEIDAADAVMRFGAPPMEKRFQVHAGKKETFRLLNSKLQSSMVPGLGLGSFGSGFFLVSDAFAHKVQPGIVPLGEIQRGLMQLIRETFSSFQYKPSHEVTAGMTGITFLLHVCDEVVLYEMIPSRAARGMPWHYWEAGGDAIHNGWHNSLFFEQAIWRLLSAAPAATVDGGVVRLRGFRKLKHRCGPQPSLPPPSGVPDPPAAAPTCGDLSVTIDREEAYSRMTDSQRCSLYCRLEHLVPVGTAVRELIGRVHYDTCAVVSNSGALLKWRYGAEIDRADAVLRFNLATTDLATRPHAGFKETFRLLNSRLQSQAVSGLRLGGFDKGLFLVTDGWPRDNMPVGDPSIAKSELFAAQPGIVPMGEVQHGLMEVLVRTFPDFKHHLGHEVTSGMLGITLMLHLCEEVVLYEMVPSKAAKGMPWHYWEKWGDATKNSWHNSLQFEYAVWRLLAGPHDTSRTGVLRLEGFRRHKQQCL